MALGSIAAAMLFGGVKLNAVGKVPLNKVLLSSCRLSIVTVLNGLAAVCNAYFAGGGGFYPQIVGMGSHVGLPKVPLDRALLISYRLSIV